MFNLTMKILRNEFGKHDTVYESNSATVFGPAPTRERKIFERRASAFMQYSTSSFEATSEVGSKLCT